MRKHPLKKIVPAEQAPRHIAVLMRRQGIERKQAERMVELITVLADDRPEEPIGRHSNAQIAEAVDWHGPPSDLIDDLVAAGVLRWDEEKELVHVPQEEE